MNSCIITKLKAGGDGYARTTRAGKTVYAHRLAYEQTKGKIPIGMTIDHLCSVKNCINVEHLEVVTREENTKRRFYSQTHCKRGHKLSGDNLMFQSGGRRRCRECYLSAKRKYNHKVYYGLQG